jgi:hypothetical protein
MGMGEGSPSFPALHLREVDRDGAYHGITPLYLA